MYIEEISFNNELSGCDLEAADKILGQNSLVRDPNLDYLLGLFDGDRLLAVAGAYQHTIRSLAVDPEFQSQDLASKLISEVIYRQFAKGYDRLFLYTKLKNENLFSGLGFYPIARTDQLVFLTNDRKYFDAYIEELKKKTKAQVVLKTPESENLTFGAIVLNANPVTNGHLYLIESTAKAVDFLHLFLVSEDVSEFSFQDRYQLLKESTKHIPNLIYQETKEFLVSQATFPAYFVESDRDLAIAQARLDAQVFLKISQELKISQRFIGHEPYSQVTAIYNQAMQDVFTDSHVKLHISERKKYKDSYISATRVRAILQDISSSAISYAEKEKKFIELKAYLPNPVVSFIQGKYDFLKKLG